MSTTGDRGISGHTPGPWRASGNNTYVIPPNGHPYKVCQLRGEYVDNPNREADAALIAAAPDLLEAAEKAKRIIEGEWGDVPYTLKRALRKARGHGSGRARGE